MEPGFHSGSHPPSHDLGNGHLTPSSEIIPNLVASLDSSMKPSSAHGCGRVYLMGCFLERFPGSREEDTGIKGPLFHLWIFLHLHVRPLPAAPVNLWQWLVIVYSRGAEEELGNLGPYQYQAASESTFTPLDNVFSYYLCQFGPAFSLPCNWIHPTETSPLNCIGKHEFLNPSKGMASLLEEFWEGP